MLEINHEEMAWLIRRHYDTNQALFIFGTIGIGKSDGIRESGKTLAAQQKRTYVEWNKLTEQGKQNLLKPDEINQVFIMADLRISQLEPSDLQIPDISSNSEYLQRKYDLLFKVASQENAKGIMFFDELNLAPPSLQSSLYQIINDNEFGDLKLSDGIFRVAAGNTQEDRTNVFEMGTALYDRFSIFKLVPPGIEEWETWAINNNINTQIISFLHYKPGFLHRMPNDDNSDVVQPTPRSWAKLSELMNGIKNYDQIELLASGRIGDGVAVEFTAFCKLSEKIDLMKILNNPAKAKLPDLDRTDMQYSLISGIVDIYKKKKSKKHLGSILTISNRLAPEFGVLMLRLTKKTSPGYFNNVRNMKEFDVLHKKYAKYLL